MTKLRNLIAHRIGIIFCGTKNPKPLPPASEEEIPLEPVDVLYEQSQWALDELHSRADAIDAKCAAAFTSSSFLLAGMAALQAAIAAHVARISAQTETNVRWLGGGMAVTFLLVVGFSIWAMWPRTFTLAPIPPELLKKFYNKSDEETKVAITRSRIGSYDDTAKKVRNKARLMIASFVFVVIESFLLVLILVVAAVSL